jgi:tetratricopeptide (TPR) repeat protein
MADNPRIEELRRRVQLDPASIAFAALAEEYRRMGRHEEAIQTCRAGLQRHPAYLSARVTLGRALIETAEYDSAREELETVLKSAPENLAAIRGLAQIHERQGQSTEMDPHLAALMNAEVERISLAAATPAPAPSAPPAPAEPAAPVARAEAPIAARLEAQVEADVEAQAGAHVEAAVEPTVEAPAVAAAPIVEAPAVSAAPIVEAAAALVLEAAPGRPIEIARVPFVAPATEPEAETEFEPEMELEPVFADSIAASGPDPAMIATLARLERFLVAIDAARHP